MTSPSPTLLPVTASDEERRRFLDNLQSESTRKFIPTLIFLGLVAVVGLIGNSIVLIVYSRKRRRNATDILIMAIAAFDLSINVVAVPNEMYDIFHLWDFHNIPLCRFRGFFNAFTTMASAMALLAIAVIRYRKICRPFGKQVTVRMARILAVFIPFMCGVFAMPFLILYGLQTKATKRKDVVGKECFIDDEYGDTIWPKLFTGFLFLLFLSAYVPLIILYLLVGIQAWKHSKAHGIPMVSTTQSDGTFSETNDSDDNYRRLAHLHLINNTKNGTKEEIIQEENAMENISLDSVDNEEPICTDNLANYYKEKNGDAFETKGQRPIFSRENQYPRDAPNVKSVDTTDEEVKLQTSNNGKRSNFDDHARQKSCSRRKDRNRKVLNRTTLMLLIISLIYIIAYLPYLILVSLKFASSSFYDEMSSVEESLYNIFLRFFFINSAANAVIYSLCDIRFRSQVCNIFKCKRNEMKL